MKRSLETFFAQLTCATDDRYDIQEAVFMRWANSLVDGAVKELNDITDTKFLSGFVQLITGEPFVSFLKKKFFFIVQVL
ncbi:unnamed protein product [Gongylonema pulchrum]|uniref:GLOBIN domain-containing protein n=1 Tax=Gongylonema pulchrum TaxID=637853 RepID=A0A183F007_9BILA|nr:unnamed protein product [Gongylonema pulchrum]